MAKIPIPPSVWQRILDFLNAGSSGTITINIKEGRVMNVKFSSDETFRPTD